MEHRSIERVGSAQDLVAALTAGAQPEPGAVTDEAIEELAALVLNGERSTGALTTVLAKTLAIAQSRLTRSTVATTLAAVAAPGESAAVDAILDAYAANQYDPFLAPAILASLGALATRDRLARVEFIRTAFRAAADADRYALIEVARWIGRLYASEPSTDLRDLLDRLLASSDPLVEAEVRYQVAVLEFCDALLAANDGELHNRLASANAAFLRAEGSEEVRPDASLFLALGSALDAFAQLSTDARAAAARAAAAADDLRRLAFDPHVTPWLDYASPSLLLLQSRILGVASALQGAANSMTTADEWTNFDQAVVELAALVALIQSPPPGEGPDGRLGGALATLGTRVVVPRLGPLLSKSLNRRRLAKVVANYATEPNDGQTLLALRCLQDAALAIDLPVEAGNEARWQEELIELASASGTTPGDLLRTFRQDIETQSFADWLAARGMAPSTLAAESPQLYSPEPNVDETVRKLLRHLSTHLGDYPRQQSVKLLRVLVAVVEFVFAVRQDLPEYVLCEADGGRGQQASEADLQEDLFRDLRRRFGREASYERQRIAGGRTDSGVFFTDCGFPIEVKHEFRKVAPEHVRSSYLAQPDDYAGAMDRISFLMILDLRAQNCAGHRNGDVSGTPVALYRMSDSFWVDSLAADPQVSDAKQNAVIVALVPGNRARPSSRTSYSQRPRRRGSSD